MPLQLSVEEKKEIFLFIEKSFADYEFDKTLVNEVHALIERACVQDFSAVDLNSVMDKRNEKVSHVLACTVILLFSKSEEAQSLFYNTFSEMVVCYPPSFMEAINSLNEGIREREKELLLSFRNIMVVASKLLPPKNHQLLLLRLVSRLDGSDGRYISGSGPTVFTRLRRAIIEHEGKVIPVKKKVLKRNYEGDGQSPSSSKRTKKLFDTTLADDGVYLTPSAQNNFGIGIFH